VLHDLKSVNKTDRSALLRKLNWKIVNQNPLGTIPVNDRTKRFANSCWRICGNSTLETSS